MAKKLQIKTKLFEEPSGSSPENKKDKKLELIKDDKITTKIFRLREWDAKIFEDLIAKISKLSGGERIDATKLLRGALYLADKRKPEILLKGIMEAERHSLAYKFYQED